MRKCFARELETAPRGDKVPAHESEDVNAALEFDIFPSAHEFFVRISQQIPLPVDPEETQRAERDPPRLPCRNTIAMYIRIYGRHTPQHTGGPRRHREVQTERFMRVQRGAPVPHQHEEMEIGPHTAAEPPHDPLKFLQSRAAMILRFPTLGGSLVSTASRQHLAKRRHFDLVVAGTNAIIHFRGAVGTHGGPSLLELLSTQGKQVVGVLVVVRMVFGREVVGRDGVGDDLLVVQTRATEGRGSRGRVVGADSGLQGGTLCEGAEGAWGVTPASENGDRLGGGVGDVVKDLTILCVGGAGSARK